MLLHLKCRSLPQKHTACLNASTPLRLRLGASRGDGAAAGLGLGVELEVSVALPLLLGTSFLFGQGKSEKGVAA